MSEPIYLDHHATTPVDPRVVEKMLPYFTETYGNPASIDHIHGHNAKKAVDTARESIASSLGCRKASEIVFTSGATEANNLALIGAWRRLKGKGKHIIASSIEHPAVLDTLKYLETEGASVTLLPVDRDGLVDLNTLKDAFTDETILVSIMFANNEIGTIQPIKEIGEFVKSRNALFHVDAAQAVGHETIDVYDMNIDLLAFSAHKFYGPKGIGGLFMRSYAPMVRLSPVSFGGGHERSLRPGTLNVPGIVGMAEALKIADRERTAEQQRLEGLAASIQSALVSEFPDIKFNGKQGAKLTHNLSITIPGVESKALIQILKNKLSISSGSACSATKVEASHVLRAIGLSEDECFQTIRIGLGRSSKDTDLIVEYLVDGIKTIKDSCK